ncbi:sigma-70 family RNA polymerase sigma factor [Actinomycetospora termitidis]|uniref:Sigma-70 family RNA polymerase sigma factor n=1 Tax=Actinomycetospora termitidis TaxID=3053470 RepID=A0ABT7MHV8_9PSEU|nr:sigma-70 family RNA polymerase sigma factor [Actinomycetospora sp. Odt1-22]MDL5160264.1 sigma-70 family RNA polymerase sigma factor [Actinomycetospora sp. Odt1-22]
MAEIGDGAAGSGLPPGPSDADLLGVIRGRPADTESTLAFGTLYGRHRDAARALARQLARSPSDADDLVSAAFARLLEILRAGGGPTEAFRAYLLTSLRHLAYDRTRAERRLDLTDDMGDVIGVDPDRTIIPFADPAVAGLERSLAARAFATLPERWQAVLWHLEVEGDSPADIAPLFGLTPNAVSALGYRAREGLRQAYLQEHLAGSGPSAPPKDRRHRETEEKLGAYTRGGLSKRDAARVEEHLRECAECRSLAAELREVNSGIVRSAIGPLVLGAALVGYLAARQGTWVPSTAEFVIAGAGVVGVIGAIGGLTRTPEVPRARRLGAAVVGLAGLGVATATVLGGAPDAPPVAAPAVVVPLPDVGSVPVPSAPAVPAPTAPQDAGSGALGSSGPGRSSPDGQRAAVGATPADPERTDDAAPGRSNASAGSARESRADEVQQIPSSGQVTSGRWSEGPAPERTAPTRIVAAPPLVELRVLGVGVEVAREREADRRGLLEPVLDVLLH